MKIKVCGLKYISNIQSVIQLAPDYIGFIFYKGSKRYVGNERLLPSYTLLIKEVKKVGVFVDEDKSVITAIVKDFGLDIIQLHGNETPQFCENVRKLAPIVKSFHITHSFDFNILKDYQDVCDHFLFDSPSQDYGGSGQVFDWELLNNYTLEKSFFLSGGICLENVKPILELNHPSFMAIDINSKFEIEPGLKNIDKIKSFIHEIRN